ncbi:MAG: restriction endonuclease [Lachnospiraceae bacterium]|nr:restriction endonuclease [Lachnospiraceae bacterium]
MQQNTTDFIMIILIIFVVLILITAAAVAVRRYRRGRRGSAMDEMEGHEFEYFCAELLEKRGFVDVEVTRGSGDFGVDILAEKDGVTYAIQCKRYHAPVGVEAVLRTYGGRDYYDRMVGVVMTNQYFTAPAAEAAGKLRILLWDRGYLDSMLEEE